MGNLSQKIKNSIKDITNLFKENFQITNFPIIELAGGHGINRKDLLSKNLLVNLFEINNESGKSVSDSFSDSISQKIDLFNNIVDNFPGIILVMDLQGKCRFINKFAVDNLDGKTWLGVDAKEAFSEEQYEKFKKKHNKIAEEGFFIEVDYFVDVQGELRTFEKYYFLVEDESENVIVLLGIDITDKIIMENKLNDLAYKDSLTGIYNYNFLIMKIEELINNDQKFSLIYIDIEKFRVINELYGYEVGDKVLLQIVKTINFYILKLGQAKNNILTRFKDDEFVIIHKHSTKKQAVEFARNLIDLLKEPIIIDDIVYRLGLNVGIISYPDDGGAKETLIRKAALAKNKARLNEEIHLVAFSSDLEEEIKNEYELETEIYESLEEGEFELYLQPILNLNTEQITKAEALIRWNHKKRGLIFPGDFIPIAEKSNLILKIGEWVLEEACKILKRWEYKNIKIPISINISGKQLLQYNFPKIVEDILIKYDIEPQKIIMEVTENYIFDEAEHLNDVINRLNKMGIRFSMDDFGTGNSSMIKLKHINFAEIKIDKSFIAGLLENSRDEYLVKNIIELAKDFEIDVVAEGVESLEQYGFLAKLGCKYVQGFLFSKPIKMKDFERLFNHKYELKKLALEELDKKSGESCCLKSEKEFINKYFSLPFPVLILDKDFKIREFNDKFKDSLNWEKSEIIGESLSKISLASAVKKIQVTVQDEDDFSDNKKLPLLKKNGVFLEAIFKIDKGSFYNNLNGDIVIIITQLTKKNKSSKLGYYDFLNNLPTSILVTDIKGSIEYVNKKFTDITGYKFEEILGRNPNFLNSGLIPREVFKNLWETILQGKEWQGELYNKKKNKENYWQSVKITPIFNNDSEIEKFIASIEDITEKKTYEKRLRYLAKIDSLTGAFSRAAGIEFLETLFDEGVILKEEITLVFFDLDNLKDINDKFGHGKGDEVIKTVAEVVQKNIKKEHLFIRYGGDEFLIVLRDKENTSPEFIINKITIDLEIISRSLFSPISLSFGVTRYGEEENDNLEKMIKRADENMYLEKNKKKQAGQDD